MVEDNLNGKPGKEELKTQVQPLLLENEGGHSESQSTISILLTLRITLAD